MPGPSGTALKLAVQKPLTQVCAMHRLSPMTNTAPTFIGSVEVCEIVGFNRSTLSRWVKDGIAIPALRLPGATGSMLFTRDEADRLADLYNTPKSERGAA